MRKHSTVTVTVCYLLSVVVGYIVTFVAVQSLYYSSLNPTYTPIVGVDPKSSIIFAAALLVIPYITGGLVLGNFGVSNARRVTVLGLCTTVGERSMILGMGILVLSAFPGPISSTMNSLWGPESNLVTLISAEALPYFTWAYLVLGIPVSLLVLYATTKVITNWRRSRLHLNKRQSH